LLISLGLYFISTYVNTVSLAVNYTINASLLFVFLMVIAFRERKFIKEVMHKA
jgi:predicted membrane protein